MRRFPLLLPLLLLCACAATTQRRSDNDAVRREVSQEITRICALPPPERQAEIERAKKESGMAIICPTH